MLDPKFLRGNLEELKAKLATRGYDLDVAFWQEVENQRKSIQVKTEALQAKKMKVPKKSVSLKETAKMPVSL